MFYNNNQHGNSMDPKLSPSNPLPSYLNQSQSISEAILNYVNDNKSTHDAATLLNHIQEMVKFQQTQEQLKMVQQEQSTLQNFNQHHLYNSSHNNHTHHQQQTQSSSSMNQHAQPNHYQMNHKDSHHREDPHSVVSMNAVVDHHSKNNVSPSSSSAPSHVNNTTSKQSTPSSSSSTNAAATSPAAQQDVTLYIKPARKTAKYFLTYIPPKLYCSPYKYDLMLRVPINISENYDFIFNLLDSESREKVTKNNKGDEAYCVERTKTQRKNYLKPGFVNVTFRLNFSICSFHNGRKPFILCIYLRNKNVNQNTQNTGGDVEGDKLNLISDPFSIFARKTGKGQSNDDDWGLPNQFSDSNSNDSSEEEEEEEEKKKKKKKKKEKAPKRKRNSDETKKEKKKKTQHEPEISRQPEVSTIEIPKIDYEEVPISSMIQSLHKEDITTKLASEYGQLTDNNLSSGNIFDGDQWSQLFGSTTLSPDIAPFLQEEIVTCQQQPQAQPAIYQQFGSTSAPQAQPADLTMLLYQELLKQYNNRTNTNQNVQLPSFLSPPSTTCPPEVSCASTSHDANWSREYQKQTLQNTTTAEPIDLGRLLLARNTNTVPQAPRSEQDGNNLLLSLDESLYSKLFGSSYNPNNYFF